jgi:hypothetical protein
MTRPIASNATDKGRAQNRRTEFNITSATSAAARKAARAGGGGRRRRPASTPKARAAHIPGQGGGWGEEGETGRTQGA